jgi:hypothetical protein
MYVDDIADMRTLRPWVALSVTMERRAIRLGKLLAGELFIHRERVRHAAALLRVIADEYFREQPSLTRDLVWAVSEFEETERCEVAGAAVFVAFAEGRAKNEDLVKTLTSSLLDQLALICQHAIEAMPNASLQLPFEQESQRRLADAHPNTGLHTTPTMSNHCSATTGADRPEVGTIDAAANDPRDRGLALLHAAAVKGRVNVCPRGAAPFVIEVPDANVSRSRSYRGTLKVEGQVDGLRWHSLAFSVHGAPLPNPGGSDDLNSGKRFFSGKVDARIFLKLLAHFIDRSVCVFELHEFVDPLGIPGKGSTYEMSSFEFVRKPDTGLFVEE